MSKTTHEQEQNYRRNLSHVQFYKRTTHHGTPIDGHVLARTQVDARSSPIVLAILFVTITIVQLKIVFV